jgi:Abnormal spindle-like microcephaly-assoc'd, ASPM-SPD-2-Hydin
VQTIALSGFATKPVAYVVPGTLPFQPQLLNTASAPESVVLMNIGNGPLHVSSVVALAPFAQTNNCNAPIAPGGGCTVFVSFKPNATGAATGTLNFTSNAGSQDLTLTGTGSTAGQVVKVSPAAILFPPQEISVKSAGQGVSITNSGTTPVSFTGASTTTAFAETSTCTATIPAGKSCTATVTFTPTAAGTATGTLTVKLSTGSQTVSLAGTGVRAGSWPTTLSLSPSPMSFTGYVVGDNPVQKLTVTNTSEDTIAILKVALSGDPSITEMSTCPADLAPRATCTISVTFTPMAQGTFTSTLTVTEGSGAQDKVTITGEAGPDS